MVLVDGLGGGCTKIPRVNSFVAANRLAAGPCSCTAPTH